MSNGRLRGFTYLFVLLFVIWLALTSSLNGQELAVGLLISIVLALFLACEYTGLGFPPFTPVRILFFIFYVFVLLWEIIKANFDVAYRVVHPKMPIKPGVVVIKTGLKSDIAKMLLANSITLTPGTFTLDIIGDRLLIHWINVKADDIDQATKLIGEKFEKYLRVIFK